MGQKVHPISFRLGVVKQWESRWYASPQEYPSLLHEDIVIRREIKRRFLHAGVSRVDIDRPGVTYTIDTLRDIRAQHPDAELFFITGADAVAEIMQWKDADLMWDLAHFVAVTRPGYSSPDGVTLPEGKVDTLEIPALAISSTDVRRRAEHDEPVWYLVPDGVVQSIGKHGLYSYED